MHCLVVQGIAVLEINLALKTELVDRTEYIHIIFRYAHMLYLLVGYVSPRKPCVVSFYPCNRKSQDRNCPTDINTVYRVHPITSLFHITLVVSNPSVGMSEKGTPTRKIAMRRGVSLSKLYKLYPQSCIYFLQVISNLKSIESLCLLFQFPFSKSSVWVVKVPLYDQLSWLTSH